MRSTNTVQPIPKKDWYAVAPFLDQRKPNDQEFEFIIPKDLQLQMVYEMFFTKHNCLTLFQISNKYSAYDALLTSGITTGKDKGTVVTIPIEFKRRPKTRAYYYASGGALLEKQKYESLLIEKNSIKSPTAFYIMMFIDVVLIFNIKEDPTINWKWEKHKKNDESILDEDQVYVDKEVMYLPYSKADYIISTHSWERKDYTQLSDYIKSQYKKFNGE